MRAFVTSMAAAVALTCAPVVASAATMTFDDFGFESVGEPTYTENGITITGNSGLGDYGPPGHIDAQNSPAPSRVSFTMKGLFDAISFDLTPWGFDYFTCKKDNCTTHSYKNVSVKGYRGDDVVAEMLFNMGEQTATYSVFLGERFTNLTSLVIEALLPESTTTASCATNPKGEKPAGCAMLASTRMTSTGRSRLDMASSSVCCNRRSPQV